MHVFGTEASSDGSTVSAFLVLPNAKSEFYIYILYIYKRKSQAKDKLRIVSYKLFDSLFISPVYLIASFYINQTELQTVKKEFYYFIQFNFKIFQ